MKKLLSLVAAAGLLAGSLLATVTPAHAEETGTEVTLTSGIVVKDLVISSKSCRAIPMSLSFEATPSDATFDEVQAAVWVWGGKVSQAKAEIDYLLAGGSERELSNTKGYGGWKPIQWCPTKTKENVTGLGRFTVAGEHVAWWNPGADQEAQPDGYFRLDDATTFTVKQASKASSAKASKKGTKRTLSAKYTYFDVSKKAWKAMPKGTKVELQRRASNGAGDWKKVKTVKVGSKGVAKTTYKTKSTFQYRFVYAGSSTKAPVTSKTLKK